MSVSRFFRFLACFCLVLLFLSGTAVGEKTILLTFTGDCTIGCTELTRNLPDSFDSIITREGYQYPFLNYLDLFAEDDCTVINMEGVLSDSHADEQKGKTFRFRGKTDYVKILTGASIEAAGLANNHINDFGAQGMNATKKTLEENGIHWFYVQDIWILEKDGIRIAFVSADETTTNKYFYQIRDSILQLKAENKADAIVVCYHSGTEYSLRHDRTQERMANSFINCGADLIIMNHSHVVQGIQQINNRSVCYALGNFVFGGNNIIKTKKQGSMTATALYCMVVRAELRFSDDGTYLGQQLTLYPGFASDDPEWNHYQPRPVHGEDADRVIAAVQYDTPFRLPEITRTETFDYVALPYLRAEN